MDDIRQNDRMLCFRKLSTTHPSIITQIVPIKITTSYQYPSGIIGIIIEPAKSASIPE